MIPLFSARPVKLDVGSRSPRKKTSFGSSRLPRFSVAFVPHPLVSVGVFVRPDVLPVRTMGHACVLCSTFVAGLLATRLMKLSMAVGFSEASEATVFTPLVKAPVVWLLPITLFCLAMLL